MDPHARTLLDQQMARLADGDREPLSRVLATLWPPLRRFTGKLLACDADADDAAQRAMIAVFSRAHDYERGRDALTWALGIAMWECRTLWRTHARRRATVAVPEHPDEGPSPEDALIHDQLVAALEHALGSLGPADRAALGLERVADGVVGATLRKRRQRALGRLRRAWSRMHGTR